MELTNLIAVTGTADHVTLAFKDREGGEHAVVVTHRAASSVVDALLRMLASVEPKRGPALDIEAAMPLPNGQGIVATTRDGLRITLLLDEKAATIVAAAAAAVSQTHVPGKVH